MFLCTICKESVYIPTSLSCNHTFCLLCIKNHLYNRSFCPLCYVQVHISELQIKKGVYESRLCKYERKLCFINGRFICMEDRIENNMGMLKEENKNRQEFSTTNNGNNSNDSNSNSSNSNDKSSNSSNDNDNNNSNSMNNKISNDNSSNDKSYSNNNSVNSSNSNSMNENNLEVLNIFKPCKISKLPKIKPFVFCKITEVKLKKLCKKYNLKIGSKDEMLDRLKDFYLLYTVEKETVNPLSLAGLSNIVNKKIRKKKMNIEDYIKKQIHNINEIRNSFIEKHKKKI